MARLPDAHRNILQWLAAGDDHHAIAERLDVDVLAVAPLVVVAHRKLDRLLDQNIRHATKGANGVPTFD